MKRFSEQLHKKAMTVKLRVAEQRELRERVVSYMEYHPLPADMKAKKATEKSIILNEEYKVISVPWALLSRWAVGTFAIILIAVPFVAERSVPGDNLYAVKKFNEEVRGTLAFDAVQKVEWETELLNRRIAEARLLASEGRLTDEVEAEVAQAVRTHSDNAQKSIEVLRAEDADEAVLASIALETTLSVQSAALQEDDKEEALREGEQGEPKVSLLTSAVEESRVKTNATNASSTIPAFDKVMAKVELNTTRVYELRDSLSGKASKEEIAEITRRIEDIERSVQKAINLREENDAEARALLVHSLQRTQKLIVFMADIKVSRAIDIETIVPVELTDEEKQAILDAYQLELDEKIPAIKEALSLLEEESIAEKVLVGLAEVDAILTSSTSTTEYTEKRTAVETALNLVRDMYAFLEIGQVPTVETPEVNEDKASSTDGTASSSDGTLDETKATSTTESEVLNRATSTDTNGVNVDRE